MTGPTHPFTDMLGQEIQVGDVVAYATGRGSSCQVRIAEVREIKWRQKMDGGFWTFKVWAWFESSWNGASAAIPARAVKLSEPSISRTVRIGDKSVLPSGRYELGMDD